MHARPCRPHWSGARPRDAQVFLAVPTAEVGAAGVRGLEAGGRCCSHPPVHGTAFLPTARLLHPQMSAVPRAALGETLIFRKEGQRLLCSICSPARGPRAEFPACKQVFAAGGAWGEMCFPGWRQPGIPVPAQDTGPGGSSTEMGHAVAGRLAGPCQTGRTEAGREASQAGAWACWRQQVEAPLEVWGGPHQGPPARGRRRIATAVWPGERRRQDTVYSRAHCWEVSGRRCGTHAILKLKVIP